MILRLPRFLRTRRRTRFIILVLTSFGLLTWIRSSIPQKWNPFDKEAAIERYDHKATADELDCFNDKTASVEGIPNVVHFIWGLKDPDLDFTAYLAIRSAKIALNPDKIKLHTKSLNRDGEWFKKIEKDVEVVAHDLSKEFGSLIRSGWQAAHLADVLRLDILLKEGGIYLDSDVISLRPFTQVLRNSRDVVLGHEGGNRWGLCNAIIIARKGARFLSRWMESYATFSSRRWNYHSVLLPKQMAERYPDEVCPLEPAVLFWPTWTTNDIRYMHEVIDEAEAERVRLSLAENGGSLYRNQLAYHMWSQVAHKPYLKNLSPQVIQSKNTRFNMMVRRFL